jgi:hypothetical protein
MARRQITEIERTTECPWCHAKPGERCTTFNGKPANVAGGFHAARRGRTAGTAGRQQAAAAPRGKPGTTSGTDPYRDFPPAQALALEVLAARARLGEPAWTFSTRHRPALEALAARGLVEWKHWTLPRTCLAWLTGAGREAVLDVRYKPPGIALLEEALHLRMNGERAPGGNETWRDWDLRTETFLRSLLPEPDAAP